MPRSPEGFDGEPAPLERQMEGMEPVWQRIAVREGLREPQLDRVASFWHADGDLGRGIECVTDMTKSRLAGFTGDVRTRRLRRVFDRLRAPSTSSPRDGGRDQVAHRADSAGLPRLVDTLPARSLP